MNSISSYTQYGVYGLDDALWWWPQTLRRCTGVWLSRTLFVNIFGQQFSSRGV